MRAALNQMEDAGMKNGAEPLKVALFELDAAQQEMESFVLADSKSVTEAIIASLEGMK